MSDQSNNAKSNILNMTEGNIPKLLVKFAIPMLVGNLFQQIYNLVDSIIVGQFVGANALGAIGATGSVIFMFIALCNGIGSGGGIVASQMFGAGNVKEVKSSITNVAYIMLFVAAVVCVISYAFTPGLLRLLNTPQEIIADSIIYMRMMCIGLPLVAVYNFSASMLRALGDSKGPLYFLIVSSIINVCLDIFFVRSLNMSVFGAALATVIAQLLAGVGCLIYASITNEYFRLQKTDFKINLSIIKETIRLGVPMSLQFSLIAISCMGLQAVVNSFGPTAVAAFTATSRIEQVVHQPYTSLGLALATFSGQNYGAKKIDRIKKGFINSTWIMIGMSILLLIIMQFFGRNLVALFVSDEAVIQMGATGVKITSLFYGVLGLIYITRGTQNGVGDAAFALINGIVEVIARIILPAVLVTLPFMGVWGIWWSAGLVWLISSIFCTWRYLSYRKRYFGSNELNNL